MPLHSQYYINQAWVSIDSEADSIHFHLSGQDPIEWSTSTVDGWGNLITVGNLLQSPDDADILVTKYSSGGSLLWQESYDGPGNGMDYGLTVITDAQSAVYVAGVVTDTSGFFDIMLLKYSADSTLVWSRRWGGASGLHDAPTALYFDGSGNLIVAGVSYSATTLTDWVIMKISAGGSPVWLRTYDYNDLHEVPVKIDEDSTGNIVVSGFSESTAGAWAIAQVPFAASDGTLGTEAREGISGIDLNRPVRVAHNEAGELFIAGNAPGGGEKTLRIIKLDAFLDIAWNEPYAQSGYDLSVRSLGVDSLGRVYVAANSKRQNGPRHAELVSFDPEGELRWIRPYHSMIPGGSAEAKAMRVAASGHVSLACATASDTGLDFATLIFDTLGVVRMERQLNSVYSADDSPTDLTFLDGEAVYVTGTAKGGGVVKYLTAKYELMKQGVDVVLVDSVPAYKAFELIVKFAPAIVDTAFVDDRTQRYTLIEDVLPDSVIQDLETRLDYSLERTHAVKIFYRLSTAHTESITRLGDTIPIPPFWSAFLLVFPDDAEIDSLLPGFNLEEEYVEYAEYNYLYQLADSEPDDPYFLSNEQLSLHAYEEAPFPDAHINILPAWELETGKDYVKVGVVDSPVLWAHQDFVNNTFGGSQVVDGWDYVNDTHIFNVIDPISSHGTSVAGIIAAKRDNETGIAGIAGGGEDGQSVENLGAQLFSLGINFGDGFGAAVASAAIVDGASFNPNIDPVGFGLDIQNYSWYGVFGSYLLKNAVEFAFRNHVTQVACRGNEGDFQNQYPACYDDEWVINVGSSGTDGEHYLGQDGSNGNGWVPEICNLDGSSFGGEMDIIAPGVTELVSTLIFPNDPNEYVAPCTQNINVFPVPFGTGNAYQTFAGTSAAAPHVSGVAALMLSRHHIIQGQLNNLAPEDVEYIIQNYSTDIGAPNYPTGYDEENGWGRLNAGASVEQVNLPCWTVWHSGSPDNVTWVHDSTVTVDNPFGPEDIEYKRYKVTHSYSNEFDSGIEVMDGWRRMSSTFGKGPQLDIQGSWASYDIDFEENTAEVSVITYTWEKADEYWDPAPPEELTTAYSLYLDRCLTSTDEIQSPSLVHVFPNPAGDRVRLDWVGLKKLDSIEVYSSDGRLLARYTDIGQSDGIELNITDYLPGIYFLRILGRETVIGKSFVKQ